MGIIYVLPASGLDWLRHRTEELSQRTAEFRDLPEGKFLSVSPALVFEVKTNVSHKQVGRRFRYALAESFS